MHNTENGPEQGGEQQQASGRSTVSAAMGPGGGGAASAVSAATNPGSGGGGPRECAGCGKRITERFLLKALDLFWHEDCLKCGCCDCRLGEVGSTLYTKANLILCKRDYLRLFGTTGYCAACNKVIPAFEMVMRAKSNVYHLECFACQQCNHRFCVGDRFYLCDNKILCEYDYEERLVFANMAYNPSSLAHIRRQVSNLQPAADNMSACQRFLQRCGDAPNQQQQQYPPPTHPAPANPTATSNCCAVLLPPFCHHPPIERLITAASCYSEKNLLQQPHHLQPQQPHVAVQPPSSSGPQRDDGSSGYGSPDSDTFDIATAHHVQ